MKKAVAVAAGACVTGALAVGACASSNVNATVYGPPDAYSDGASSSSEEAAERSDGRMDEDEYYDVRLLENEMVYGPPPSTSGSGSSSFGDLI